MSAICRIAVASCLLCAAERVEAQIFPSAGRATLTQKLGLTTVTVAYDRLVGVDDSAFGRAIRWDNPWTAGHDSAMTIQFDTDIVLWSGEVNHTAEHSVKAGKYSVWIEPKREGDWILILNGVASSSARRYRGALTDSLRFGIVRYPASIHADTVLVDYPLIARKSALLDIHFGTTHIAFAIQTP